jgi:hypothetical protein
MRISKKVLKELKEKGGAWIGIVFPPGGKGKHSVVALQHPTKNDDPVAVLGAAIVTNWREYLANKIPSPDVFICSEDRARLEEGDHMDDFLSKMGNPVFASKLFHRANYEALMADDLVTGRLLRVEWSEQPVAIYSFAGGEDLSGKRESELSPEERRKAL